MRLIDADVLKTLFDVRYDTAFIQERTRENKEQWNGYCTGINWGINTITEAPTIDAVPVVHGRWIEHKWAEEENGLLVSNYECSACHSWERDEGYYCPNCGAKMDG